MTALDRADRVVTQLLELLYRVERRGVLLDCERLNEFNRDLDIKISTLQAQFDADPTLPRTYHPKKGYKKKPKEGAKPPKQVSADAPLIEITPGVWAWQKAFTAGYYKSVLDYAKSRGHKIRTCRGNDARETSDAKALLWMWRRYKDDHYRDFIEFRQLGKLRGTYGEWPSSAFDDGHRLVRTHYTLRPITGRLSSTNPNLQNIPKDGSLAKQFRRCIVPRAGNVFLRADLASAEAVIMGWLAGDPTFIRLAKMGIHKYAMAKLLGIGVDLNRPDTEIAKQLDEVKANAEPALYRKIKVGVYGAMYLVGPRTQFEQNPDVFENQAEAKKFIQFCLRLSDKIQAYQRRIIAQVTRSKYYQNPFGRRIDYWDLPGGDGPAVVSVGPQSIVADIMIESMLQLDLPEMVMQVHDELVFDVAREQVDCVREKVVRVMGQKWNELNGLSIPVEVKVSESFA